MMLGLTSIQRDRSPYITEWVAFHYLVGFRKFYIYLNRCEDNTAEVLRRLSSVIDIKCTTISTTNKPQLVAYQHAYNTYSHEVDWMAFIDADEFLFPVQSLNIGEALEEFDSINLSAVAVYLANFGSSGHTNDPPGLLIDNYKRRGRLGTCNLIKSIVRGNQQALCTSANFFRTLNGTFDEKLRPISASTSEHEPSFEKLRINHYLLQSQEYFIKHKLFSGAADLVDGDGYVRGRVPGSMTPYWHANDVNDVLDDSVDKYSATLRAFTYNLTNRLNLEEAIGPKELYFSRFDQYKAQLQNCSSVHNNLVVLDLRQQEIIYTGSRYMIYALFPQCNISITVLWGENQQNTVFTISTFPFKDRSHSKTNIEKLCIDYGGSGSDITGSFQVDNDRVDTLLLELIARINADG